MELDANGDYSGNKTGFDPSTRTLYLYFKDATSIEAGKPYIIKWGGDGTNNIVSPVFTGVTMTTYAATGVSIENNEYYTVEAQNGGLNAVKFRGSYSPVSLTPNDMSVYFLGTSINNNNQLVSTLYYPNAANNSDGKYYVNSCRAYFWVDLGNAANVSAFVLDFGEETTGVREVRGVNEVIEVNDNSWYSLDGRKLEGKPTQKGMYIHNGKKFVMK